MLYIFWLIAYFFCGSFLLLAVFSNEKKNKEINESGFTFYVLTFIFAGIFLHEGTSKIVYYFLIDTLPNTGESINKFSAWIFVAILYVLFFLGQCFLAGRTGRYFEKKQKIKNEIIEEEKNKSKIDLETIKKF